MKSKVKNGEEKGRYQKGRKGKRREERGRYQKGRKGRKGEEVLYVREDKNGEEKGRSFKLCENESSICRVV
jgi:hypothetical protein